MSVVFPMRRNPYTRRAPLSLRKPSRTFNSLCLPMNMPYLSFSEDIFSEPMFTKKIRAKEELVNGRAMRIKIPFSFMSCL